MKILAIETSCDDTGIAIMEINGAKNPSFKVLSNVISSQIEIHKQYGGVFPAMAKREHQKNLVPVLIRALEEAGLLIKKTKPEMAVNLSGDKNATIDKILEREPELLKKITPFFKKYNLPADEAGKPDIDFIAVTNGPGLEPCLWVGVNLARVLSYFWNIPIIATNHIESHILVNYLNRKEIKFPAIALVVSGGHTQIILVKKIGDYKILGETRDDAAGECFDKAAKILGLEYPGGPIISKLAEKGEAGRITLPRPMINTKDYDFSFSGLKTAILYHHQKQNKTTQKNKQYIADMCAEIQQSIVDVLTKKTIQATKDYSAKTIILGGGVSANHELKTQLLIKLHEDLPNVEFLFPEIDHSTDNGLMTAITGYFHKKETTSWENLKADSNLRVS
jgi:N6-L-threonylcarbamoyladenine synthase